MVLQSSPSMSSRHNDDELNDVEHFEETDEESDGNGDE
jgi:hypothetical protein